VQRDGRPGPEEPGTGVGHEESASRITGQDHADAGPDTADPTTDPTPDPTDGRPAAPEEPTSPSGAAPPSGPAPWEPPAPPPDPAELGQEAASAVGVGAPSSPGTWAHPAGAPAQAGYGPAPAPGQPYPPGPYQPTPYPAPSISRQPSRRSSWTAPDPTRTHRWGLGAYLLAQSVFWLVGGLIGGYLIITGAEPSAGLLVVALSAPTLLAAGTALWLTKVRGNGPRIDLRLEWSWRDVGRGVLFGIGGLLITIPASAVYIAIVGEGATSAVGDAFGGIRAGPALAVLVLVIVVFIAPTCEEILYRGLLWGAVEKIAGRWVALPVSTVIFAIAHLEPMRTPLLLIVAIPIAVARLYTGRLLTSIVAHQVNNLAPGILLMLGLLGVVQMP
jgi:uncharacterized protein